MAEIYTAALQPFFFRTTILSHGWYQLAPFMWDDGASILGYTIRLTSGKVAVVRIKDAPGGVQAAAWPEPDDRERDELYEKVAWMLALNRDLSAFYAAAAGEPKLQRAVVQAMGRQLRSPTLFEDVIRTLLTTNTLWGATQRMCLNLIERWGDPLVGEPPVEFAAQAHPLRRAFPTTERLAELDEATLRAEGRVGYRAPYILDLARRVASGVLDLEALKHAEDLPTPELRKRLLGIKGVGGYAAAVLLMLLGRYDAIPVDSWALKSVSNE